MARSDPAVVIRRLLDDEHIHEQIAQAGAGVRDAYRRARSLPAQQAVQDKAVYDRVRQAAAGVTEATRRALAKPPPKRRRGRAGLTVLILAGTGAIVVWAARRDRQRAAPAATAGPVATAPGAPGAPVAPG